MLKHFTAVYLAFTRKERRGIVFLLLLVMLSALLPLFYPLLYKPRWAAAPPPLKDEMAALELNEPQDGYQRTAYRSRAGHRFEKNSYQREEEPAGELFNFDPNTLSADGWQRLGLRERTIQTIQNYLSKGGHFYKPEDIGKIWGLHEDLVQRLLPYVQIAAREKPVYANTYTAYNKEERPRYVPKMTEVNSADTTAWIALPGIGSKLAARIVNFRDKLGGFYKVEQVAETYGLPDSVFQRIKERIVLSAGVVKQLNINTAALDELKQHPYIRYQLANLLVQYRKQHGNYTTVADIKKIMLVTDELYTKLAPYLTVE